MLAKMGKEVTDRFTNSAQNNFLASAATAGPNPVSRERIPGNPGTAKTETAKKVPPQSSKSPRSRAPLSKGSMAGYKGEKSATIRMNGSGYDNPNLHAARDRRPTPSKSKRMEVPKRSFSDVNRTIDSRKRPNPPRKSR